MSTLMKCGCTAQGTDKDGRPVCVVHVGMHAGASIPADPPNLRGRIAQCVYCKSARPSSLDLPFFEMGYVMRGVKKMDHDSFYCGCYGWD